MNSIEFDKYIFWERYVRLCKEIDSTPTAVAKKLDVTSGSVTGWKRGSTPNGEILSKIADYFGCTIDYLLGNTNYPKNTISISLKVLMIFQSVIKNYLNSFDYNFATNLDEEECVGYIRFYKKVVATEKNFSAYVSDSNKECDTIDIKVFEIAEIIEVVSKALSEMDKYEVGNLNFLDQKEEFQ